MSVASKERLFPAKIKPKDSFRVFPVSDRSFAEIATAEPIAEFERLYSCPSLLYLSMIEEFASILRIYFLPDSQSLSGWNLFSPGRHQ